MVKQTRRDSKDNKTFIYYQNLGENPKYAKGCSKGSNSRGRDLLCRQDTTLPTSYFTVFKNKKELLHYRPKP